VDTASAAGLAPSRAADDPHRHAVKLRAPAKLNLHLGVYPGRDGRGYHHTDSVMVALSLADLVTVIERGATGAEGVRPALLLSEDVGVPSRENTAWIAATRLCEEFGRPPTYAIRIEKRIPSQSGLGGASSDAASVILALCQLWGINADAAAGDPCVVNVARSVGADVAFFLHPVPSLLTGAGDVVERVFSQMDGLPVVLVRPRAGVSTAEAYREFDVAPEVPEPADAMCDALAAGDRQAVALRLHNNLAPASERLVPACGEVTRWLRAQEGVMGAQVTGSGSCAFALCDTAMSARRIAAAAREACEDWWSISCETVGSKAQFC